MCGMLIEGSICREKSQCMTLGPCLIELVLHCQSKCQGRDFMLNMTCRRKIHGMHTSDRAQRV